MQRIRMGNTLVPIIACVWTLQTAGERSDRRALTTFSSDDLDVMGDQSASIVNVSIDAMTDGEASAPSQSNIAGALIEGLRNTPKPAYQRGEQLRRDLPPLCERDFTQLCPMNFLLVRRSRGDGTPACIPTDDYEGPCTSDLFIPSYVVGQLARASWARRCQADWPCKLCRRDFGFQCPQEWNPVKNSLHKCISTRDYHGPCAGMVDFRDMTTLQKKQWSSSCLAWWPCVETRPVELGPDADMPLTREAVRCNLS